MQLYCEAFMLIVGSVHTCFYGHRLLVAGWSGGDNVVKWRRHGGIAWKFF